LYDICIAFLPAISILISPLTFVSQLDDHDKEKEQLREQLDRLLQELEEREKAPEPTIPNRLLQPSTQASQSSGDGDSSARSSARSRSARSASGDSATPTEDSSTVPSSQWSKKKQVSGSRSGSVGQEAVWGSRNRLGG
jgi:hypothetical protein